MGTGWLWLLLSLLAAFGAAVPLDRERPGDDHEEIHKKITDLDQKASGVATNAAVEKETEKLSNKPQDTKAVAPLQNSPELHDSDNLSVNQQSSTSIHTSSITKPDSKKLGGNAESAGSNPSLQKTPLLKSDIKNSLAPEEGIANSGGISSQNTVPGSQSNTKDLEKKEKSSDQNQNAQSGAASAQDTPHRVDLPESNKAEIKKTKSEVKEAGNSAPDSAVPHSSTKDLEKKKEPSDQKQKAEPGPASAQDTPHKVDPPESNKVEEKKGNSEEKQAENSKKDSFVLKSETEDSKQNMEPSANQKAQPNPASAQDTPHKVDPAESNKVEEKKANSEEKQAENSIKDSSVLKSKTEDSKQNMEPSVEEKKANSEEKEVKFPASGSEIDISSGLDDGTKKSEKHTEGMPKTGSENSHFFAYLVTTAIVVAALYIAYHNKRKIIAFALEGKKAKLTRRPKSSDYQRLDQKI